MTMQRLTTADGIEAVLRHTDHRVRELEELQERHHLLLNQHLGSQAVQSGNHPQGILAVNATTDILATAFNVGQMIRVRAVPGTSADILYICLGDNAATTAYSWVQIATG